MRLTEEKQERIRRSYHIEHKSMRQIAREEEVSREAVKGALSDTPLQLFPSRKSRTAPVFGPFQTRVEQFLARNERLPRKQRYSSHKIFEMLRAEGYQGCESRIRQFIAKWNRAHQPAEVFLPLEFEPGQDAQVDWVRRVGAYEIPVLHGGGRE
jgi:transposase